MAKNKHGNSNPGGKSKRKRSLSTEDEELPPPPAEESPMQEDDDSDAASASASEKEGEGEEEEVLSEESGDDGEEYSSPAPPARSFKSDGRYHNKQRCLTLCSRGVTARYRHLLEDLRTLMVSGITREETIELMGTLGATIPAAEKRRANKTKIWNMAAEELWGIRE